MKANRKMKHGKGNEQYVLMTNRNGKKLEKARTSNFHLPFIYRVGLPNDYVKMGAFKINKECG